MFIVSEIQTVNGQTAVLTNVFSALNEAESKFHTVLAAAAVSRVDVHAAILYTNSGNVIKSEYYRHDDETEK